jgi:hypothetical protein
MLYILYDLYISANIVQNRSTMASDGQGFPRSIMLQNKHQPIVIRCET